MCSDTTQPSVESTLALVQKMHEGQMRQDGVPYWQHAMRVMCHLSEISPDFAKNAALLHDVVEDTEATFDMLARLGHRDDTIDIVRLLTNDFEDGDPRDTEEELNAFFVIYGLKVKRIIASENPWAIRIKHADMTENLDERALRSLDPELASHLRRKYAEPYAALNNAMTRMRLYGL